MDKRSWIVIANASRAKFYELGPQRSMQLLFELDHSASRAYTRDLVSDKQGRTNSRMGTGRSSYEPETEPKHEEMVHFAKEIAKKINSEQDHLERLFLAASPSFLGLLRQELTAPLQKLISREVAKDLTQLHESDLLSYFLF